MHPVKFAVAVYESAPICAFALPVCAQVPSAGIETMSELQLPLVYQFNFGESHLPTKVHAEPQPVHATCAAAPTRCLFENAELAGHILSPSLTMQDRKPGGA